MILFVYSCISSADLACGQGKFRCFVLKSIRSLLDEWDHPPKSRLIKMFEIPLFPLNTVLFQAHRSICTFSKSVTKEMINLCLLEKRPFGVVLIRNGMEALGPLAEPFHIGCTAEIAHVQHLDDGV